MREGHEPPSFALSFSPWSPCLTRVPSNGSGTCCVLRLPWLQNPPAIPVGNFTVHSLKSTLLSYLHELPDDIGDDRNAHDHHRRSSKELYSRDDVFLSTATARGGSFGLQAMHAAAPWRPAQVETFSKAFDTSQRGFFSFTRTEPGPHPIAPKSSISFTEVAGPAPIPDSLNSGDLPASEADQPADSHFTFQDQLRPVDETTLVFCMRQASHLKRVTPDPFALHF